MIAKQVAPIGRTNGHDIIRDPGAVAYAPERTLEQRVEDLEETVALLRAALAGAAGSLLPVV